MPPAAAPKISVPLRERRSSAFASWSSRALTVCGTIPWAAGKKNAVAVPRTSCSAISCQTSAAPVSTSTAIAACAAPAIESDTTMTWWRGSRSAQMPPTRMKTTCGSVLAATTSPRSVAEPPMSSTAKARAIGANADPKRDTVRPRKSSRKSRSASGLRAARSTGLRYIGRRRALLVLQRLEDVEPRGATRREDRGHDPDEDRRDREDDQLNDWKREVDEVHPRYEQGPENDAEQADQNRQRKQDIEDVQHGAQTRDLVVDELAPRRHLRVRELRQASLERGPVRVRLATFHDHEGEEVARLLVEAVPRLRRDGDRAER